jgi:putative ABC transport system permease protein
VRAVIIAMPGIASTLALPVAERTRGVGMLRAISMRRGQAGQMIAAESVIAAVIGAIPGTALRLGLGAMMAVAFTRSQQLTVVIPTGPSVLCIMTAALPGLLVAIAPARRAARMNLVAAIAAE